MEKTKVWLGLDLSVNSTGLAILDSSGKILMANIITPEKYPGHSKDRYPKSTLIKARYVANEIGTIINQAFETYNVQKIVVEEINSGGGGILAAKSLSFLHGMLFWDFLDKLDYFEMIKTSVWRGRAGINVAATRRVNRKLNPLGHKQPIVEYVNKIYGTDFKLEDNDMVEAIAICLAYLFINKILDK
jgi:hypothetical protein